MVTPVQFPKANLIQTPASREVSIPREPKPADGAKETSGFDDLVGAALNRVDGALKGADQTVADFLQGRTGIHEMALSLEKADLNLRLLARVRNRIIEAYKEISRMNV